MIPVVKFLVVGILLGIEGKVFGHRLFFPSGDNDEQANFEDSRNGNDIKDVMYMSSLRMTDVQDIPQKTYTDKEMPSCAMNSPHKVLCEDDQDYNNDVEVHFDEARKKLNVSDEVFSSVLIKMIQDELVNTVLPRINGNDLLKDPVCPSNQRIIFPKRGMTKDKEWVFLMNQGDVKQGVRVEECWKNSRLRSQGSPERYLCSLTGDNGGESDCVQKYVFKKMFTIDNTGKELVMESILMPSCCVCMHKKSRARVGNFDPQEYFDDMY